MIKYFLNIKEQQKLELFQYLLLSRNGYTRNELVHLFNLNVTTLRRYLLEVEEDLTKVFDGTITLHLNDKGKINIESEVSTGYATSTLKNYYIRQNSLYIILISLIKKPYSSVTELSMDLSVSEALVYKNLSKIKEMLDLFGAELTIEPNIRSNFGGNELGVRYFLYLIYWNLYDTLEYQIFTDSFPKEFTDTDFLLNSLDIKKELSHAQMIKLKIMSGIISYRIVYFNKYIEINSDIIQDLQFLYKKIPNLNLKLYNVSSEILETESIFFSYLVKGLIYDVDSFLDKEMIVTNYLNSDLLIAEEIKQLLERLKEELGLIYSEQRYTETYYQTLLAFIYFKHIHFENDSLLTNPIQENINIHERNQKYQNMTTNFNRIADELSFYKNISPIDKERMNLFLSIIYEINSQVKPVTVYVMLTSDMTVVQLIKSRLLKIFNYESIKFCESPEEAEVIITDTFEGSNDGKVFLFHSIHDEQTWKSLNEFISTILLNRIIN
ncbi:helix-turn-helix domain-containing protein [Vagococcus fluvialis]|uniref:helix-turn-helix domain-containing protein n=1 Tax=Vagococcus fluvialis TaxID=2738 RepID=UPI00379F472A